MPESKRPCARTMDQVNEIMIHELDGHVIRRESLGNGILEFWQVEGQVVIVHMYEGENGWAYYLPAKEFKSDKAAEEIRKHLSK